MDFTYINSLQEEDKYKEIVRKAKDIVAATKIIKKSVIAKQLGYFPQQFSLIFPILVAVADNA